MHNILLSLNYVINTLFCKLYTRKKIKIKKIYYNYFSKSHLKLEKETNLNKLDFYLTLLLQVVCLRKINKTNKINKNKCKLYNIFIFGFPFFIL